MDGWLVYMLACRGGSLYVGVTNDLVKRFNAHRTGRGARYTRAHPPQGVVFVQQTVDKGSALSLEYRLRTLSAPAKRMIAAFHGTRGVTPPST